MLKKKYKFNQTLWGMPPGFIMGDIKYAVLHQDNDVSEQGCIICSSDEVAIITKDWEQDSKSSGIMSVPSNEVWFETSDGEYYDPMYVQVEEEYGDTFPDLPTFDREKTQAANIGNGSIYKWVFTEDIIRINDGSTGMFIEDDYYSTALPISKVFLPVNYWLNTSELESYLFLYCSDLESFTIPNSVTSIGYGAFADCSSLTSITIPESVTSIGNNAFDGCSSLTVPVYNAHCFAYMPTLYSGAYTIPEGIKQIAGAAFLRCSSLTSITIPNSVTSIGDFAFYGCSSLTSVTIPNSVISIGSDAFYGCSSLKSITCEATTPPTLGSYNNLSNVTAVYVPAESVEAYKTATNWSYYSDIIQAMP